MHGAIVWRRTRMCRLRQRAAAFNCMPLFVVVYAAGCLLVLHVPARCHPALLALGCYELKTGRHPVRLLTAGD